MLDEPSREHKSVGMGGFIFYAVRRPIIFPWQGHVQLQQQAGGATGEWARRSKV